MIGPTVSGQLCINYVSEHLTGRSVFYDICSTPDLSLSDTDDTVGRLGNDISFEFAREMYVVTGNKAYAKHMDRFLLKKSFCWSVDDLLPSCFYVLAENDVPSVDNLPDIFSTYRCVLSLVVQKQSILDYYVVRTIPAHPSSRNQRPSLSTRDENGVCIRILRAFVLGLYPHSESLSRVLFTFDTRASLYGYLWKMLAADAKTQREFLCSVENVILLSFFEYMVYCTYTYCPCEFRCIFFCGLDTVSGRNVLKTCKHICNGVRESWSKCLVGMHNQGYDYLNILCGKALDKCKRLCKKDHVHSERRVGSFPVVVNPVSYRCFLYKSLGDSFVANLKKRQFCGVFVRGKGGSSLTDTYTRYVHDVTLLALKQPRLSLFKEYLVSFDFGIMKHFPYLHGCELTYLIHAFGSCYSSRNVALVYYIQNSFYWDLLPRVFFEKQWELYIKIRSVNQYQADLLRYWFVCVKCSVIYKKIKVDVRLNVDDMSKRTCSLCGKDDSVVQIDMIGKILHICDNRYIMNTDCVLFDRQFLLGVAENMRSVRYFQSGKYATDLHQNTPLLLRHAEMLTSYLFSLKRKGFSSLRAYVNVQSLHPFQYVQTLYTSEAYLHTSRVARVYLTIFNQYPHWRVTSMVQPRIALPDASDVDKCRDFDDSVLKTHCFLCRSRHVEFHWRTFDIVLMCHRNIALCQKHNDVYQDLCLSSLLDWHTISAVLRFEVLGRK